MVKLGDVVVVSLSVVSSGFVVSSPKGRRRMTCQAQEYFILIEEDFGSRSPAMHNAAFSEVGLPHRYGVLELPTSIEVSTSEAAEELRSKLRSPSFGGASVTIPHKQRVMPFLDELTPAAQRIGAVNTVIPRDGVLTGDNTDWIGICEAIQGPLNRRPSENNRRALIVGTGGTARAASYAVTEGTAARGQAPYDLSIFARDFDKAKALADIFQGRAIDLSENPTFDVIISTIPGSANFTLPSSIFASKPVVLDAAYKPAETALLAQARSHGCPIAQGATMLWYQGVAQFHLWTGLDPPADVMRSAVFNGVPDLENY